MMTNKEIMDMYEGLYEISQKPELQFNIRISYIFAKTKNILEPFYKAIIENKDKILQQYGTSNENGSWHISNEVLKEFEQEWNHLMSIENEIELQQVKLEDFGDTRIGVELLGKILPLIKD